MLSLGKLYLIPVPISAHEGLNHLPAFNLSIVQSLTYFISENAKAARSHLKLLGYTHLQTAVIEELNQHKKEEQFSDLLTPLLHGFNVGLMSDAGCPGIADPGAAIVQLAHQKNIEVIPLSGPSSIVLSIMASGFNGQNFAFVGYLPIERFDKVKRLKELEMLAIKHKQAQFFIETPYRNDQLFDIILSTLSPSTLLFIGKDITGQAQFLKSHSIQQWRSLPKPFMNKVPLVFGIYG